MKMKASSGDSGGPSVPVKRVLDPGYDGESRQRQRIRQIEIGKGTDGYIRYLQDVPKDQRIPGVHLDTPPVSPGVNAIMSKRDFDVQLRTWRRFLHNFDDVEHSDQPRRAAEAAVAPADSSDGLSLCSSRDGRKRGAQQSAGGTKQSKNSKQESQRQADQRGTPLQTAATPPARSHWPEGGGGQPAPTRKVSMKRIPDDWPDEALHRRQSEESVTPLRPRQSRSRRSWRKRRSSGEYDWWSTQAEEEEEVQTPSPQSGPRSQAHTAEEHTTSPQQRAQDAVYQDPQPSVEAQSLPPPPPPPPVPAAVPFAPCACAACTPAQPPPNWAPASAQAPAYVWLMPQPVPQPQLQLAPPPVQQLRPVPGRINYDYSVPATLVSPVTTVSAPQRGRPAESEHSGSAPGSDLEAVLPYL
eukprot:TRINITY_DN23920_c5_g1_i1.p1 TRINITY_DN23920_c5_g1~~TRINITY_DN23920_c5_g1_i1.p1  ORF type:complete len:466 (+),score=87.85 TRINITY_DN23920_c5_g1_i1:163-1398(+)